MTKHQKVNNPLFLCFGCSPGEIIEFEFRFIHFFGFCILDYTTTESTGPVDKELSLGVGKLGTLMGGSNDGASLMQHQAYSSSFDCTEPKDLISISLNMSSTPLCFSGNIAKGEKDETYWVGSMVALASGDFEPLVRSQYDLMSKLHVLDEISGRTIVSWADRLGANTASGSSMLLYSKIQGIPGHIGKATKNFIELDLFVFKERPLAISERSKEKALSIMQTYFQSYQPDHMSGIGVADQAYTNMVISSLNKHHSLTSTPSVRTQFQSLLDRTIQMWLAVGIDCGIDWICRFQKNMAEQTQGWEHGTFAAEPAPEDKERITNAAKDLLSYFEKSRDNAENGFELYLKGTIQFLTILIDKRLKLLTFNPRRIHCGTNDWAVTAAISNRSWVAVPATVSKLPYYLEKAWIIEPFDPDAELEQTKRDHLPTRLAQKDGKSGSAKEAMFWCPVLPSDSEHDSRTQPPQWDGPNNWRLRRRNRIIGYKTIEGDGVTVKLMKNQRVYGYEDYDWLQINKAFEALRIEAAQEIIRQ